MQSFRLIPSRPRVVLAAVFVAVVGACRDYSTDPRRPSPQTSVAVTYCAVAAPTWLAFRDGDGSWTRAMPEVVGDRRTFRHTFSEERAAIAYVTQLGGTSFMELRVLYATPVELGAESDTTAADCTSGLHKTLHGNVAALDAGQSVDVSVGPSARVAVVPRPPLDFTIGNVANGPQDLVAIRTVQWSLPARLILRRDVELPDGANISPLDFTSTEAIDLVSANAIVENLQGLPALRVSGLVTPRGQFALPLASQQTGETHYVALPANALAADELQMLRVSTGGDTPRTADTFFRTPTDRTVTLGEPIVAPTISAISSGGASVVRLRAQFVQQPEYDKATSIVYEQPARTAFVAVSMTPAYALAAAGGYTLDVPDLGSADGFDPTWGLKAGAFVTWTAERQGGTLPFGRSAVPADGDTRRVTLTSGVLQSP